jgi:hypothetical protein
MSQSQSPLDPLRDRVTQWIAEGFNNREIRDALAEMGIPSSERSLSRAYRRWGIERNSNVFVPSKEGIKWNGDDDVEIQGKTVSASEKTTPKDLMLQRDLDPEEWETASLSMSEWDGPSGERKSSLKVHIKRIAPVELLVPARIDGPKFHKQGKRLKKREQTRRVVFVGDQQAPYHNEDLHEAFLDFLYDWKPDEGILIGDTIDFPDISRHPAKPEIHVSPQECVDSGYMILRKYREAHEETAWKKLAGNHDERLRRYQIDKAPRIFGLRRAEVPDEELELPVLDVGHLLRLDELGIEYVRPVGDYEHEQIKVSQYLAACHGWIARRGSGASALGTIEQLGYSVVHGHTHRQGIIHKTRHDIDGMTTVLAGCETGCMCRIDGLGYAKAPDWQNGFATAEVFPDGTFHLDLATYVDSTLYFRGKQY